MTKLEMLAMLRLLSALESVMVAQVKVPDYLLENLSTNVDVLVREILKDQGCGQGTC